MLQQIYDFFKVNASQHRGLLILAGLLVLLLGYIFWAEDRGGSSEPLEISTLQLNTSSQRISYDSLFVFDPSTADSSTFVALGFSPNQARTILNYRRSLGGLFDSKEQFAKCYAVSDSMYQRLSAYLQVDNFGAHPSIPKSIFSIDINTIPLNKLRTHSNVDDKFATKLFSSKLRYGGFVSLEQIYDIFKNDYDKIFSLASSLNFDTLSIVRYEVNVDAVEMLSQHPYITRPFAQAIVDYREQNGDIESFQTLKNLKYFPKSKEKYLRYYVCF